MLQLSVTTSVLTKNRYGTQRTAMAQQIWELWPPNISKDEMSDSMKIRNDRTTGCETCHKNNTNFEAGR